MYVENLKLVAMAVLYMAVILVCSALLMWSHNNTTLGRESPCTPACFLPKC